MQTRLSVRPLKRFIGLLMAYGCLAFATAPAVSQAGSADARFQGTGKADPIRITSVTSKPTGDKGSSAITFDIAWDHSWRAAWEEPESRHGGKGALKIENWDAAWIFVKFHKPGADGWSHATLSTNAADHTVPAGAMLDVGLTDTPSAGPGAGGKRGLGVFVYRNAPGSGPNNWKGVTLRWWHGMDGVTNLDKIAVAEALKARPQQVKGGRVPSIDKPAASEDTAIETALGGKPLAAGTKRNADTLEFAVYAIPMVYVPEGAFWVGDGVVTTNDESLLSVETEETGDTEDNASEPAPKGDKAAKGASPKGKKPGHPEKPLPVIAAQFSAGNGTEPFRIESEDALTLGGASRTSLGNRDGIRGADDFSGILGRNLPSRFPKGFAAFYCMRYEISQAEFTTFLNTLSSKQQADVMGAMGWGHHGIAVAMAGTPATYNTDAPYLACDGFSYLDGARYAAWAGLRPMTELEYEKSCRGPLKPVPGEYAWGTDKIAGSNSPLPPQDGYAVADPYTPNERVVWEGANGPDAERGNAAWGGTTMRSDIHDPRKASYAVNEINRPLRVGIFATPDSGRVRAGASYWGIMELTGNVFEPTVAVGNPLGRQFAGTHGDGTPITHSVWRLRESSFLLRGCGVFGWFSQKTCLRVSDRGSLRDKSFMGFRCVRTARPTATAESSDEFKRQVQTLFHQALRIDNMSVVQGDAKTTTVRFDIAWDESWRNATNHDAAWVFFKAQGESAKNWQHVKLVADPPSPGSSGAASTVLNPAGYGQEAGTKLEFVVPDGADGFTGVFLRRAADGSGPLAAKGVTAVLDLSSLSPETRNLKPSIQAFGLEMIYVAEGPFYLGSGGTEPNRFYQYTDGSQNTRPYQVTDGGPLPTGPQQGRLWALGVAPDATDAGEVPAAFPTGYEAFYCMKYPIKQGQFAGFLEMQSEVQSYEHAFQEGDWPVCIKYSQSKGVGMTWWQGAAFGAWAGLRPMSELEYEKACRGPSKPKPDEVGPGYWGIRLLNMGGPIEQTVSVGEAAGRAFAGTHGRGTTSLPADWPPPEGNGVMLRGACFGNQTSEARTSYRSKPSRDNTITEQAVSLPNNDFKGWRGARTAPALTPAARKEGEPPGNSKLELDPLPDLGKADITLFYLAGRFRNAENKPLKVELASPLPDACFPEGAASRSFTAAPDGSTPFRILTVLTRQTARSIRKVQMVPCRIQSSDGAVLAEQSVRLPLPDPLTAMAPAVIGAITGGAVPVGITNATDRAHVVTIEMQPPPVMTMSETSRRLEIPPGGSASTAFAAQAQAASPGAYLTRYRVTVGSGAPQAGDTVAELRSQSRWWVGRSQLSKIGPSLDADDGAVTPEAGGDELDALLGNPGKKQPAKKPASDDAAWAAAPADLFQAGKPPERWAQVTHGASLWMGKLNPLPDADTIVLAATRVTAPADREAVIQVGSETVGWTWLDDKLLASKDFGVPPGSKPFVGRIWVNGEVVYDSRPEAKERRKPVRLRKGGNTMLVQCRANGDKPETLANVFVIFCDAKDGTRMDDLMLDVEKK